MLMTPTELALTLRSIADLVERGDSYEGHVEYRIPDGPPCDRLEVSGSYRYGNAEHEQGFVRRIKASIIKASETSLSSNVPEDA